MSDLKNFYNVNENELNIFDIHNNNNDKKEFNFILFMYVKEELIKNKNNKMNNNNNNNNLNFNKKKNNFNQKKKFTTTLLEDDNMYNWKLCLTLETKNKNIASEFQKIISENSKKQPEKIVKQFELYDEKNNKEKLGQYDILICWDNLFNNDNSNIEIISSNNNNNNNKI